MRIGSRAGMRVNTGAMDAGMLLNSTHVLLRETSSRKRTTQDRLANPRETGGDKIVMLSGQRPAPTAVLRAFSCPTHVKVRHASDSYLVVVAQGSSPI